MEEEVHEEKPLVVTAVRKTKDVDVSSGPPVYHRQVTVASGTWDIFGQEGGGDTYQMLDISVVEGNIVIKHPDIDYPFIIPDGDWDKMTRDEQAAILKTIAEYDQSPMLREAISFRTTMSGTLRY